MTVVHDEVIVSSYKDTERKGNFSVTYSGIKFYVLDPRPEEINIKDIAHHLSQQCRYGGAVRKPYSVAEHSVRCAEKAPKGLGLSTLMHDASEAWLVDIPRPIKYLDEFSAYNVIEDNIMKIVSEKYGFEWPMPKEVRDIDDGILVQEWASLMPLNKELMSEEFFQRVAAYRGSLIKPWSAEEAEFRFLDTFDYYINGGL